MYVNDMVAVERDIKEALDLQAEDARVGRWTEVAAVLREAGVSTDARLSVMESLAKSLGGGAGRVVKEAVVAAAGLLAGLYGKVRKHPVSRMLRDDSTALSLAATGYAMLYTSATALRDQRTAAVALRHLRDITPLVTRIAGVIPGTVVAELGEEFPNLDAEAVQRGAVATREAWAQEPPSTM
jgi:hypothetical protein